MGYQTAFKKLMYLLMYPVPFNVQDYEKQKRLGTTEFRKIPLFVMYYLTNIKRFLSYAKTMPKSYCQCHNWFM